MNRDNHDKEMLKAIKSIAQSLKIIAKQMKPKVTVIDKQEAKKPDYEGDGYYDGELIYDTWICPCCEKRYEVDYDEYDYCPNCGQKIDWTPEEENQNERNKNSETL